MDIEFALSLAQDTAQRLKGESCYVDLVLELPGSRFLLLEADGAIVATFSFDRREADALYSWAVDHGVYTVDTPARGVRFF